LIDYFDVCRDEELIDALGGDILVDYFGSTAELTHVLLADGGVAGAPRRERDEDFVEFEEVLLYYLDDLLFFIFIVFDAIQLPQLDVVLKTVLHRPLGVLFPVSEH
jgi:hypothetical protein